MRDAETIFMSDDELHDALSNSGLPLLLRNCSLDYEHEVLGWSCKAGASFLHSLFKLQDLIPDTHTSHPFNSYLKTQPSASVTSRLPSNLIPPALHPDPTHRPALHSNCFFFPSNSINIPHLYAISQSVYFL
jgi:hypothetical protein